MDWDWNGLVSEKGVFWLVEHHGSCLGVRSVTDLGHRKGMDLKNFVPGMRNLASCVATIRELNNKSKTIRKDVEK